MKSASLMVVVVCCVISLFLHQVTARPYETQQVNAKERQDLIKYAAKILQVLMKPAGGVRSETYQAEGKRNSGMLDAVIQMPDLFNVGK